MRLPSDAARKKVEEIKPRKDVQPLVKEYLKSLVHQVGRKPKKSQRSEARKLLEVELATLQDWQDGSKVRASLRFWRHTRASLTPLAHTHAALRHVDRRRI